MLKAIELKPKMRIGRWTLIRPRRLPIRANPAHFRNYWECRCACGAIRNIGEYMLRIGRTTSCGCYRTELSTARLWRHGRYGTQEYRAYKNAKNRCYRVVDRGYANYGGRGIQMCARWRRSFLEFFADMGPCPPGYTLEREDNEGHYEPGNCVWALMKTNCRNRRTNRRITFNGTTRTLAEWAEVAGLPYKTLHGRLSAHAWDFARAITTPRRLLNRARPT